MPNSFLFSYAIGTGASPLSPVLSLDGTRVAWIENRTAASEATNIYDECNSLWSAYATLYQQWKLVYRIGAINRGRGHRPASALTVLRDWKEFSRQAMEYPLAD